MLRNVETVRDYSSADYVIADGYRLPIFYAKDMKNISEKLIFLYMTTVMVLPHKT